MQGGKKIFYGWYMVLGQGIILMLSGGTLYYGFAVFMTYILDEYSWSLTSTSMVYGFTALEGGVMAPVYGWLVHRFGVRKPMMAGAILAVVGFFILYRLDSLFDFYVGFILVGLGFGVYWIAPMQAITNWFSAKRSTAMGLAMLGGGLGGLIAPVILWICKLYGWRFAMGASAIVVALAYIPLSLLFRTSPEPYGYEVDGVPGVKDDVERTSPARLDVRTPGVWEVVRTWRFWRIVAVFAASYLPVSAIMPHMLIYLGQKNISAELAVITISSLTVCSMAGRFLGGWIGDRVDRRLIFMVELLLLSLGMFWFAFISQSWHLVIFVALFAPAYGGSLVAQPLLVADNYGAASFAIMFGMVILPACLIWFVAPGWSGWVFETFGTYRPAWLLIGGLTLFTVPIMYFLKPPEKAKSASISYVVSVR